MNILSSSPIVTWNQVGRPWLHWSERSVASMSRSSAFISATVSERLARTAAWQAMVESISFWRSASTRLPPNCAISLSTSRASSAESAWASVIGTARTAIAFGAMAARSKPSLDKVCAWSSTVATSSALAVKVAGISNCCVGMRSTSSALLSCMHVHNHQALVVLRQDVDSGQLRQGESKRMRRILRQRRRCACRCLQCGLARSEQRCIERRRLRGAQVHSRLAKGGCARARKGHRGADLLRRWISRTGPGQRLLESVKNELVYAARIPETHLDLRRVNIRIHQRRVQVDKQHVGRMALVMKHVVIGLAHGVRQQLVPNVTAVDEEVLRVAGPARVGRLGDQTAQAKAAGLYLDRDRCFAEGLSQYCVYALLGACWMQVRLRAAVVREREAYIRARQSDAPETLFAVGKFGCGTPEEFAPGRSVEVKVAHFDRGAGNRGGGLGCGQRAAARIQPPGMRAVAGPAQQAEMGNGRNAGQRFAAESQAGNALQLLERSDFAGGVSGKRERQVVLADACAVVRDADLPDAAFGKLHSHVGSARVQAVFQQLLERGGGAIDHFPSRDLADQEVRKQVDGGHRCRSVGSERL